MFKLLIKIAVFAVVAAAALRAEAWASFFGLTEPETRHQLRLTLDTLAWLTGGLAVAGGVNLFFWDYFVSRLARRPVPRLLKSASSSLVLLLTATCIIGFVFKRDVTAIWATSGAIGVVLGFALRSIIQDLFSGIAMNIDGTLKSGDWVQLHSVNFPQHAYGQIVEIAWRVTKIQLENNNIMLVPNSLMGTVAVTNFANADHITRLQTEIVIDFDVPPERARRILLAGAQAAVGQKSILADPPPTVVVGEPTENGVEYKVRFFGKVNEYSPSSMQDAVMTQLLSHLRVAGLTPAYPKEDVFYEQRPKRLLAHEFAEDRAEILSRIEFFSRALEPAEILQLAEAIEATTYPVGHVLVRQGEEGSSLFVVAEGIADVFINQPDFAEPLRVNRIGAGQLFGEMSLLTREPRSASVVAHTGIVAYEIRHAPFERLLLTRPVIAEQLSAMMAAKRMLTDAAVRQAAVVDVERETNRLADQFLEKIRAVFGGLVPNRVAGGGPG